MKELFDRFKISKDPSFDEKLNKYNVIKLDWNSEYQNIEDQSTLISHVVRKIKKELREGFQDVSLDETDSLADSILKIYDKTGETFIILMDEYDVLIREKSDEKVFAQYLRLLNGLFKSDTLRPAISLAYLTGILPVVRDKIQSKLNNFREYTILDAISLAEYVGFTTEEVKALCDEYDMDYDECRQWYNGYHQRGYELYNPESVVMSMISGEYEGYWSRTSSYEAISDRIRENFEGTRECVVRMLAGERYIPAIPIARR
ncbi:MAG: AAA family ATPase [Eubacterium sp.]|nr:AAA family ATPase [Eubacterium sp.]